MKVTVDGKTYDHDPTRLLFSEVAFIQKKTGMKFLEWQAQLGEFDAFALAGLVYLLKKRAGEQPDWDTLDFDIATLSVENDEDEAAPAPKEAAPLGSGTATS